MSSNIDGVNKAGYIGADARIDLYFMLKEIDIALCTQRAPDCEVAANKIKKFCKQYNLKLPKGYPNEQPAQAV